MSDTYIVDTGDLRNYRIELPNLLDDLDLSVYAFRLYVHLKRVAGANGGACWQGTRALAQHCKMSVGKISEAKQELVDAKLIVIGERDTPTGPGHEIRLLDLWARNFAAFAKRSPDEQSVHDMNGSVHQVNERINPSKKEGGREDAPAHAAHGETEPNTQPSVAAESSEDALTPRPADAVIDRWEAFRGYVPGDGETIGLQRLADTYGWDALIATIEAAARAYPDNTPRAFRDTKTPINLLRSMLQRAHDEQRPAGTDTRQYQQQQQESVPQQRAGALLPSITLDTDNQLVRSLADACSIDLRLATVRQQQALQASATALAAAGATPEQVQQVAQAWRSSWRGRDGAAPTPTQLQGYWREALGQARGGNLRERERLMGELTLAQREKNYARVREIQIQMSAAAGGTA